MVKDHPIFNCGRYGRGQKQAPPVHQLMVFLRYLGMAGSGGSNPNLQHSFKTGRGANKDYKQ